MPIDPDNGEGHVDELDESADLDEEDLVTITDEDGNEIECAILAVMEHEGREYALLSPVAELAEDRDEDATLAMYVFEYSVDDEGQQLFVGVDDDATYDAVCAEFSLLIDQEGDEARE